LPGSFPYLRGIEANGNAWLTEQTVDLRFVDSDALDSLLQEFQDHELGSVRLIAGEKQLGLAKEMLQKIKGPCFLDIRGPLKPWADILGSAGSNVRPGCDPLGELAENGYSVEGASSLAADLDSAAEIIKKNSVAVFCVRGDRFICAGADHPTSIALILSSAAYYVSELLGRGLSLEQSLGAIHVRHGISSSFFPEIATLRATRYLWSQIAAFFAGKPMEGDEEPWKKAAALYQSTETSLFEISALDPYTNLLRATTQSISAVLGGSQRHTVHPFNLITDGEDAFSRRMARNIQNLIRHESYLQQVADPGAGSYYLENLTDSLARRALEEFQAWQSRGGFLEALQSGEMKKRLSEQLDASLEKVGSRKSVYVGVNQYPSMGEQVATRRFDPYKGAWSEGVPEQKDSAGLRLARASSGFENLRIHLQTISSTMGFRPEILLIPAGKLTMQRARAAFAQNFLGCAGFLVEDPGSLGEVSEATEYLKKRFAEENHILGLVLCSSDEEYGALAEAILPIAKNKDIPVLIAGNPAEKDELLSKGIAEFIHLKSNVYATLVDLQKRILGSSVEVSRS
ncbi:MAG: hypothetical protein KDK37_13155, partial [Leptospiraceae bacterium]|nr:hypothetical protein [Leptospiraceae bacterium]